MKRLAAMVAGAILVGCAHWPINKPLVGFTPDPDFLIQVKDASNRSADIGVVLAFSGGGTRAAALSYGILEALEQVRMPANPKNEGVSRTLLDEVDFISSVSGASFVSAYYGLYGKRIFADFPEKFLYRDVTHRLVGKLFLPWNWIKMGSPYFSRTDIAASYYDKILFEGKTLGDFIPATEGPTVQIQATDMVEGIPFTFAPQEFYAICSDWRTFPVTRAVTASSAFPGAFESVPVKNYAGSCGFNPKTHLAAIASSDPSKFRTEVLAKRLRVYQNTEKKKFIHLLDGGISDNLGIRAPLERMRLYQNRFDENLHPHEVLIIVVNAQTKLKNKWDLLPTIPGIREVLGATSSAFIGNTNQDTLILLDLAFSEFQKRAQLSRGKLRQFQYSIVEITFENIEDPDEREYFNAMPTTFDLPKSSVDNLREVGARLLYTSKGFQDFAKRNAITLPQL